MTELLHALFTEPGLTRLVGWLLLILLYLLASGGLVPFVARAKGRSGFGWMLIALLFSPLLALIALAAVPVREDSEDEEPSEVAEVPEFKWRKGAD